jgi:hypothetical protein
MADNIADKFEGSVDVAPDRLALVEGDERMTFGKLELCANRFRPLPGATGIYGFAFMPDVIPAANDVIMEIAGLMRIRLDPA